MAICHGTEGSGDECGGRDNGHCCAVQRLPGITGKIYGNADTMNNFWGRQKWTTGNSRYKVLFKR